MNQLDVLYRAFLDYKKQTRENRQCSNMRNAVSSACPQSDVLTFISTHCTVEKDWIDEIDKGLVFIGKAIDESRQFILSLGEVHPIENVKRVSRESVEHLAKHVDFISREPEEGNDLIPDKLYTVERLNDFAVYENRFLYMLLCYLKSFIGIRYEKIIELTNTYQGNLSMNKVLSIGRNKLTFELKMTDDRKDDWYLKEHNPLKDIIERIDCQLQTVLFYLDTPLMQEVSKVAMLKPPITKTNVLKMNENFKGAMDLYDFVTAYNKLGYTVETKTERQSPFPFAASEEISEVVMLTSFLAYKHNLKIEPFLKVSYDEETERRRVQEKEKVRLQLEKLKERITQHGDDPTEYILLLEKHNKSLEADAKSLITARQENISLKRECEELKENVNRLSKEVFEKEREIIAITQEFTERIANMLKAHQEEIDSLNEAHRIEREDMARKHFAELEALREAHRQEMFEASERHRIEREKKDSQIYELENRIEENRREHEREIEELKNAHKSEIATINNNFNQRITDLTIESSNLSSNLSKLMEEKGFIEARLFALRKEHNLIGSDEDYTSKAAFDELEHQLNFFKAFVKDEWKKTKKRIRKEVFSEELGKGKHKKKKDTDATKKDTDAPKDVNVDAPKEAVILKDDDATPKVADGFKEAVILKDKEADLAEEAVEGEKKE